MLINRDQSVSPSEICAEIISACVDLARFALHPNGDNSCLQMAVNKPDQVQLSSNYKFGNKLNLNVPTY